MKSLLLFFIVWAGISFVIGTLFAIYEGTKRVGNVDKNQKQIVIFSLVAALVLTLWKTGLIGPPIHY